MSRKDTRRALLLRVPIGLRRVVVARLPGSRPLAAKLRVLLCDALARGVLPVAVVPGAVRPSVLQLSPDERAALAAAGSGADAELTALGLIAAAVERPA